MVNKLIKQKLTENNVINTKNLIIHETLEKSSSTKQIKKKLTTETHWTTHLLDDPGKKQYDRLEVNKIATKFYFELYADQKHIKLTKSTPNKELSVENEPEFLKSEIRSIIGKLKNNNAPAYDNITNEAIKLDGDLLIKQITKLFNKILIEEIIPSDWKYSDITLIYKKSNRHKISNYRPISLSPVVAKKFFKALE